jgi:hypothetical protein
MRNFRVLAIVTACVTAGGISAFSAAPVLAQSLPGMGGGSSTLSGAASSMMGNSMGNSMGSSMGSSAMGLPSLSSSSTGNVAGVLSYCVKNNIVQGSTATSALSSLTGQSGVTSSSGYQAGEQGNIQSGSGSDFSLSGVSDEVKTKACNMVLQHAQSLL